METTDYKQAFQKEYSLQTGTEESSIDFGIHFLRRNLERTGQLALF